MKILITITKGDVGGAQAIVFAMAKGLKSRGHVVVVGMGEGGFLKRAMLQADIPVHIFASLQRTSNPFKNALFVWEMKQYLDHNRFDVVHLNSTNALLGAWGAKLSKNKPTTVFTFHGLSMLDQNHGNKLSRILYWVIFKFLLCCIDKNIFVSNDNLERAQKMKLVKSGTVIYNGLDLHDLKLIEKDTAIQSLEVACGSALRERFIVGSIGRLSWEKNYEFLVKIFPSILLIEPNALCILIGGGPHYQALYALIQNIGLEGKVYLLGEIEGAATYIKIFDLFVLPSRYEGLSISLIEAMLSHTSAIASDVGGNKEVVGADCTYPLDDEARFLELFKKVRSGEIRQDFDRQKPRFTAAAMIDALEKIYT